MSKWNFIAGHIVEGPKSRVVIGPDPDGLVACNDDGVLVPLTKDNPKLQLILAAPDLLQNLKQVVACLEFAVNALEAPEKSSIREDLILAKQAIVKAEGGS